MSVVLMRGQTDCEEAAGGTATGRTWEELHAALGKKGIPNSLEDPIAGNPVNLKRAIESLGFRCDEVGLSAILHGKATPGKTICLIHGLSHPFLAQHWVVWAGILSDGKHAFWWGDSAGTRALDPQLVADLITKGAPNCVFTVVPVEKPRKWWQRILYWLGLR